MSGDEANGTRLEILKYVMKILISDLDGTLITTKTDLEFPRGPWDWKFKEGIREAVTNYWPDFIHVVSNQGGISCRKVNEAEWEEKVEDILIQLAGDLPSRPGFTYDYCTSCSEDDWKRKPNPGMILDFLSGLPDGDHQILMIGDMDDTDRAAAKTAGVDYMDVRDFIRHYGSTEI